MPAAVFDAPVRILHLSDIHFRAGKTWDADPVLRALSRYIATEVQAGLVPDLVAITGDLAFAGKRTEYDLAWDWLERELWPALSAGSRAALPRERLLLVPGNHDADRSAVDAVAAMVQDGLLAKRDQMQIADILDDPRQRDVLLRRHVAYLELHGRWLGLPQPIPWWQRSLDIRGQRLHVAGLDSAWMSSGDSDRGRLLLGRYQLHQTLLHPHGEGADWRLALLHHPWDYLAETDGHEARQSVHLNADLVLRGHLHEPDAARVLPPDPRRACLELAAGCVYDGSPYPNAFQWIELYPNPKRVRVRFRLWNKGAWQIDRNQPGCPDGDALFDLVAPEPGYTPKPAPPPQADPRKYLEDLWDETAYIDIRGLATGRPEAHRFPVGELYIELTTTAAPTEIERARERPGRLPPGESGADGAGERPLHEALHSPRLAIVGDPGCGKTTFLRWVAHCLAGDRLGRDPEASVRRLGLAPRAQGPRLPVLLSIADWLRFVATAAERGLGPVSDKGADWLLAYLDDCARAGNWGLGADDVRRWLAAGDVVLLLDGLDEAPGRRERKRAVGLIEHLARTWKDCPLLVTSRPAAYRDDTVLSGFAHTHIRSLDAAAIDGFLGRWSRALFPESPERAESHRQALAAALASRREIRRLAQNTVMLTALAVVHWNDKRLPEQRAELYESIVRWLLIAREQRPGREKPERCRQLLALLALAMLSDPKGRQVQLPRRQAAERIAQRFGAPGDAEAIDRAEAFLAEEEIDSGILVRRGHALRFWHLTFQEYLAAWALAGRADTERTALLLGPEPAIYRPEWRETVLLLGGVLFLQGAEKIDALVAAVIDALGERPPRAEQARAAGLLGALVRDLDPFGYRPADPRYGEILKAALAVFDPGQSPAIPLADRIAAADALALAGDPRLDWGHPGRWVELPGGRFLMGAQSEDKLAPGYDPQAEQWEGPVHAVRVSGFRIAAFPVTVAEYGRFVEDEDRDDPRWWTAGGADKGPEPDAWEAQQAHSSRPVVGVSWFQAMAFCAWLTWRLRQPQGPRGAVRCPGDHVVRLPTEAEWEYAARGASGRRWPWGEEAPNAERCKCDSAKVGAPSPVGIFTRDRTPEGVTDLGGNVWEWCLDAYDEDFYTRCASREEAADPVASGEVGAPRVLRGGAFDFRAGGLRASGRGGDVPRYRDWYVGFRCVLAPPRQH